MAWDVRPDPSFSLLGTRRRFPLVPLKPTPSSPSSVSIKLTVTFHSPTHMDYSRNYTTSPSFDHTNNELFDVLLRRIDHGCDEIITRRDSTARDGRRGLPDEKIMRYEIKVTISSPRDGPTEKIFRSYQSIPLTMDDTREVILDIDRVIALFLRRHDAGFRWIAGPVREDFTHNPKVSRHRKSGPESLCCVPRSRFIEETQSFEFMPGYKIDLAFSSACSSHHSHPWTKTIRIPSRQPSPMTFTEAENVLTLITKAVTSLLEQYQEYFEQTQGFCSTDGAVCIEFRVHNNIGPQFPELNHSVSLNKLLFDEFSSRDYLQFVHELEVSVGDIRDHVDVSINALNDIEINVLDIQCGDWSIESPVAFIIDSSHMSSRRLTEALLQRLQTGVHDVLRNTSVSTSISIYKRGHLIFDRMLHGSSDPSSRYHHADRHHIPLILKERIYADISKLYKDTCAISPSASIPGLYTAIPSQNIARRNLVSRHSSTASLQTLLPEVSYSHATKNTLLRTHHSCSHSFGTIASFHDGMTPPGTPSLIFDLPSSRESLLTTPLSSQSVFNPKIHDSGYHEGDTPMTERIPSPTTPSHLSPKSKKSENVLLSTPPEMLSPKSPGVMSTPEPSKKTVRHSVSFCDSPTPQRTVSRILFTRHEFEDEKKARVEFEYPILTRSKSASELLPPAEISKVLQPRIAESFNSSTVTPLAAPSPPPVMKLTATTAISIAPVMPESSDIHNTFSGFSSINYIKSDSDSDVASVSEIEFALDEPESAKEEATQSRDKHFRSFISDNHLDHEFGAKFELETVPEEDEELTEEIVADTNLDDKVNYAKRILLKVYDEDTEDEDDAGAPVAFIPESVSSSVSEDDQFDDAISELPISENLCAEVLMAHGEELEDNLETPDIQQGNFLSSPDTDVGVEIFQDLPENILSVNKQSDNDSESSKDADFEDAVDESDAVVATEIMTGNAEAIVENTLGQDVIEMASSEIKTESEHLADAENKFTDINVHDEEISFFVLGSIIGAFESDTLIPHDSELSTLKTIPDIQDVVKREPNDTKYFPGIIFETLLVSESKQGESESAIEESPELQAVTSETSELETELQTNDVFDNLEPAIADFEFGDPPSEFEFEVCDFEFDEPQDNVLEILQASLVEVPAIEPTTQIIEVPAPALIDVNLGLVEEIHTEALLSTNTEAFVEIAVKQYTNAANGAETQELSQGLNSENQDEQESVYESVLGRSPDIPETYGDLFADIEGIEVAGASDTAVTIYIELVSTVNVSSPTLASVELPAEPVLPVEVSASSEVFEAASEALVSEAETLISKPDIHETEESDVKHMNTEISEALTPVNEIEIVTQVTIVEASPYLSEGSSVFLSFPVSPEFAQEATFTSMSEELVVPLPKPTNDEEELLGRLPTKAEGSNLRIEVPKNENTVDIGSDIEAHSTVDIFSIHSENPVEIDTMITINKDQTEEKTIYSDSRSDSKMIESEISIVMDVPLPENDSEDITLEPEPAVAEASVDTNSRETTTSPVNMQLIMAPQPLRFFPAPEPAPIQFSVSSSKPSTPAAHAAIIEDTISNYEAMIAEMEAQLGLPHLAEIDPFYDFDYTEGVSHEMGFWDHPADGMFHGFITETEAHNSPFRVFYDVDTPITSPEEASNVVPVEESSVESSTALEGHSTCAIIDDSASEAPSETSTALIPYPRHTFHIESVDNSQALVRQSQSPVAVEDPAISTSTTLLHRPSSAMALATIPGSRSSSPVIHTPTPSHATISTAGILGLHNDHTPGVGLRTMFLAAAKGRASPLSMNRSASMSWAAAPRMTSPVRLSLQRPLNLHDQDVPLAEVTSKDNEKASRPESPVPIDYYASIQIRQPMHVQRFHPSTFFPSHPIRSATSISPVLSGFEAGKMSFSMSMSQPGALGMGIGMRGSQVFRGGLFGHLKGSSSGQK